MDGSGYGDDEFIELLNLSRQVSESSFWYFDVTVCSRLESIGYGKFWREDNSNVTWRDIEIHGNYIELKNGAKIDFGWIGKGYMIDILFDILNPSFSEFIINFGWDIRVKWSHPIGLEDPCESSKIIGEILLKNASLCASSWQKRRFWDYHHLINPKTKDSPNEILTVFTYHSSACLADMYATALFVAPLETSLVILENASWLEGLIITSKWDIYQSNGFECRLF